MVWGGMAKLKCGGRVGLAEERPSARTVVARADVVVGDAAAANVVLRREFAR